MLVTGFAQFRVIRYVGERRAGVVAGMGGVAVRAEAEHVIAEGRQQLDLVVLLD
jgi:hypothetical protein